MNMNDREREVATQVCVSVRSAWIDNGAGLLVEARQGANLTTSNKTKAICDTTIRT